MLGGVTPPQISWEELDSDLESDSDSAQVWDESPKKFKFTRSRMEKERKKVLWRTLAEEVMSTTTN